MTHNDDIFVGDNDHGDALPEQQKWELSISKERYDEMMWSSLDDSMVLTEEESKNGWHFCGSWDDLLISPEMKKEYSVCECGHKEEQQKAMNNIAKLDEELGL